MTKSQAQKIKKMNKVLKAVRQRCLDCSAFNPYEVKMCPIENCPLYPYRFGTLSHKEKNPRKKEKTQQKTPSQNNPLIKTSFVTEPVESTGSTSQLNKSKDLKNGEKRN